MRCLIAVALLSPAWLSAAEYVVCNAGPPQCDIRMSKDKTELEMFLRTTAAAGDVLRFQAGETFRFDTAIRLPGKGCVAGQPLTFTTTREDWLPPPGTRVTPSHLGNMPYWIAESPSGWGFILFDAAPDNPVECVTFRGIAMTSNAEVQAPSYGGLLYWGFFLGGYNTTGSSLAALPKNITFDRIYVHGDFRHPKSSVQNFILGDASGVTVRDSFFEELRASGIENHAVNLGCGVGPIRIQNNYMAVAAVPVMIMANAARINDPNDHQRDILVEHNYFYKPYKWFAVSGPDYVGNFKYVFKNGFEMKGGEDARIQYNMVENGGDGIFEGQAFGMTFTVRTNYAQLNGVVDSSNAHRLSVPSYSTFATDALPWQIVGATNDGGRTYAWRAIDSLDPANKTFIVAGDPFPFTGNVTVLWVRHPWKRLKNVSVENNLIKNAAIPWQTLGADPYAYRDAGFYPDGGHGVNIAIRNNLAWSDAGAHKTTDLGVVNIYAQYDGVFEHNTVHHAAAFKQSWVAQLGDGAYVSSAFSKNRGFIYQNNLHRRGSYGMFSGGVGEGRAALNARFEDGHPLLLRNNTFDATSRSSYEPCNPPRDCSGNFFPATYDPGFMNVAQEDFRLGPSSPYRNAATDGTDIGTDMTRLPLVLDLKVSPSTTSAILEYDVTDPLKDQIGVLEVSTNRNLISDRCDGSENPPCYRVISDVDPTTTLHADLDSREGNEKTDKHRVWRLGFRVPLTQGTTYYYRLMVGGVTKRGQFTTDSQPRLGGPRIPVEPAPPRKKQ